MIKISLRNSVYYAECQLRDATEEELIEARQITLDLILGYIDHLEESG